MASSTKRKASKKKPCKKRKVVTRVRGKKQVKTVCVKPKATKKKPATTVKQPTQAIPKPAVNTPTSPLPAQTTPATPLGTVPVPDPTTPTVDVPVTAPIVSPIATFTGVFGIRQAERLLWRAGFGPRPGDGQRLAAMGMEAAVRSLTRPSGDAVLSGAAPVTDDGPIAPTDVWGHDLLYWLDRMVRSDQQLVERLALIFHDWFATSDAGVNSQAFMLDQTNLFRSHGLGSSFKELVLAVTQDPAMILWLNADQNQDGEINENYGRELMELFTLGANRGAYSEDDVRELARCLSGFTHDWSNELGDYNFRWEGERWDPGFKTVFGKSGKFDYKDAARMVVEHALHPSFFVTKLWSYFTPAALADSERVALEKIYVDSGYDIRSVIEPILCHPAIYTGPAMVKPPVVLTAGMLRATGQTITTDAWTWLTQMAGQRLYYPPDVSGWDDKHWLDSNTVAGRWYLVLTALDGHTHDPNDPYPAETAAAAVDGAIAFWGSPPLADAARTSLVTWAGHYSEQQSYLRASRQNALRQLVAASPDYQVS